MNTAYSHSALASLSWGELLRLYKDLKVIGADDPNFLCAADDGAAFRTDPPPGVALCFGRLGCTGLTAAGCLAAVSGADHVRPCQAFAHLDVLPSLENDEVQQLFGRVCDGPAVFVVVGDDESKFRSMQRNTA